MNRDFVEMLSALCEAGAEFLIVGAHALAAHGHPRATGDLDIWVRPSAENAERVLSALRAFGAPTFGVTREELAEPGMVLQIGIVPCRIDLLTGISGVTFDEAWPARLPIQIGELAVACIGRDDLVRNKLAAGREKDLADVSILRSDDP